MFSVMLLRLLTLVHPLYNLCLLILNPLVDLGTLGRLISVHPRREGRIVLASDLFLRLVLSTAVQGVVLVLGDCETVGYAALILCRVMLAGLSGIVYVKILG